MARQNQEGRNIRNLRKRRHGICSITASREQIVYHKLMSIAEQEVFSITYCGLVDTPKTHHLFIGHIPRDNYGIAIAKIVDKSERYFLQLVSGVDAQKFQEALKMEPNSIAEYFGYSIDTMIDDGQVRGNMVEEIAQRLSPS